MNLQIRRLLRWITQDGEVRLHRILEIHPDLGLICTFDCTDPPRCSSAFPVRRRIEDIEDAIQSGLAVLLDLEDDLFRPGNNTDLTPLQQTACARSYSYIQAMVEDQSVLALTDRRIRGPAISKACTTYPDSGGKKHTTSHNTVSATLRAWWRGGMVMAALIPNHRARGAAPAREGSRKVGRKPQFLAQHPNWAGISLTAIDTEKLQKGFERFRIRQGLTLEVAYSRTLITYWPVLSQRPNGTVQCTLPARGTVPSFDQWYYHGSKLLEDKNRQRRDQRLKHLYGERTHDDNMRPEMLSVSRLSEGPGWLCQYDATPFPITLVRAEDRSQVIKNPVLYTLTDVKTHFIFEPYVSLETETYGASQRGLYEICRKHDAAERRVQGMPQELGLPKNLAVDRGPYMSLDSSHLSSMLGVNIEQGRGSFPLARMLVETTHRMIELMLKELAGTYDWHPNALKDHKPVRDGVLTLEEFREAVRRAVNYLNEWSEIDQYPFDADMVEVNLRPYRLDLWEFCQGRRPSGFHVWPSDHLQLHLMPGDEATVTPKGLLYEGQYYTCDQAINEDWCGEEQRRLHLGRKRGQARKVPIARHWVMRDVLYLRLPGQRELERCVLVDSRSAWLDKSWPEYEAWKGRQDLMRAEERDPHNAARLELSDALQALNKTAKTRARRDKAGKSTTKMVKDIGHNHTEERNAQRRRDVPMVSVESNQLHLPTTYPALPPSTLSVQVKYGSALRKIKEQGGNREGT